MSLHDLDWHRDRRADRLVDVQSVKVISVGIVICTSTIHYILARVVHNKFKYSMKYIINKCTTSRNPIAFFSFGTYGMTCKISIWFLLYTNE